MNYLDKLKDHIKETSTTGSPMDQNELVATGLVAPKKKKKVKVVNNYNDRLCPVCGAQEVSRCRCPVGSKTCENQHEWYEEGDKVYLGNGHGGTKGKFLFKFKREVPNGL